MKPSEVIVLGSTVDLVEKIQQLFPNLDPRGFPSLEPFANLEPANVEQPFHDYLAQEASKGKGAFIQAASTVSDVLISVPEELPSNSNHRDLWELLQNIKRGFWKKWSSDFLSFLQPRKKSQDAQPHLKEDDIVVIKEKGPLGQWLKFFKCIQAMTTCS
ncbi:hypothetical protein TNCV_4851691 [Trichonephila clavipes]|nr:hypothetical protein TNCV_4851691 [Trichonephila clavipes]